MFRVMVPILDPASGRFLHHLRQGKALLSLAVAKRKADREQRRNVTDIPVLVLDDSNRVPYIAEVGA